MMKLFLFLVLVLAVFARESRLSQLSSILARLEEEERLPGQATSFKDMCSKKRLNDPQYNVRGVRQVYYAICAENGQATSFQDMCSKKRLNDPQYYGTPVRQVYYALCAENGQATSFQDMCSKKRLN